MMNSQTSSGAMSAQVDALRVPEIFYQEGSTLFHCPLCDAICSLLEETIEEHKSKKEHVKAEMEFIRKQHSMSMMGRQKDIASNNLFSKNYQQNVSKNEPASNVSLAPWVHASSLNRLDQCLTDISTQYGLSEDDQRDRMKTFKLIKHYTGAAVRASTGQLSLFGSTFTRAGLKDSDINICFEKCQPQEMLQALRSIQQQKKHFSDVDDQLYSMPPKFTFKAIESGLTCVISCSTDEYINTSETLLELFDMYDLALPLIHCIRYWAKVCEIDNGNEGMLNSYCYNLIVIRFLQEQNLLPVVGSRKYRTWAPKCEGQIGDLWIKLLRFADGLFRSKSFVINITKDTVKASLPFIWIQEPTTRRNLAKSAGKRKLVDYIATCFQKSLKYFSNKANPAGHVQLRKRVGTRSESELDIESNGSSSDGYNSDNDEGAKMLFKEDDDEADEGSSQSSDLHDVSYLLQAESDSEDDLKNNPSENQRLRNQSLNEDPTTTYVFDKKNFCGKMKRPRYCFICKSYSHVILQCPAEKYDITALPKLSVTSVNHLTKVCLNLLKCFEPSIEDVLMRRKKLQMLESHIQQTFSVAKLALFGSSSNGFGFKNSDMDICMTFADQDMYQVDMKKAIRDVELTIRRCRFVTKVIAIHSAKVPIVKFCFKEPEIEADISMYNVLAQRNTELLLAYSCIDDRVKPLGYALKYFAKACEIGDASRGTISSYGHIIMLIHYLQKRNPPVLPNLQELERQSRVPENVDGWDAQFFNRLQDISKTWPHFGKNKEPIGKLWAGFFKYYVEEFNFKAMVVSIGRSTRLTKFEKGWNRFPMAIEDPFKLDHNLVAGITEKVFRYIFRIFVNARKLFGEPVGIPPENTIEYCIQYFNSPLLKRGLTMPQDRLCKRCGKIGHIRKNCPDNNIGSRKNREKDDFKSKKRSESGEMNDSCCKVCGKPGHSMSQCTVCMGDGHKGGEHLSSDILALGGKVTPYGKDSRRTENAASKRMDQTVNNFAGQKGNLQVNTKTKNPTADNQKFLKMLSQLNMVDSGESRANSAVVGTKPTYGGNAPKTEGVVNENSSQGGARRRPEKDFFNRNEGKMSNENLRRKNEASNRYFSSGRNDSSPESDDETSSLSVHREAPKRMLHDEQKPIQKERHRRFNNKKFPEIKLSVSWSYKTQSST